MILGLSVLAGLICAGTIVPVVSLTASVSSGLAAFVTELPINMESWSKAEKSVVKTKDGEVFATFYDENREYKTLAEISDAMKKAQVGIEDHRFYQHGALDLTGTLRALVSSSGGTTQGGSTITQQLVRSIRVANAQATGDEDEMRKATEHSIGRKIQELRYAIALEKTMTKDEILEQYLNISYYGGGAYGVEAAAQRWFGVHASELDVPQAAMIAGLVQNPYKFDPELFPGASIERRNNVLDRLADPDVGMITKEEAQQYKQVPFDPSKMKKTKNGCINSKYPFLCQYVESSLIKNGTALGNTEQARKNTLYRGGLEIVTSFDPASQDAAQKRIDSKMDPEDEAIGLIGFLEPGTGRVIALAQSRNKMGMNCKLDKVTGACKLDSKGKVKDKWKGETFYNYFVDAAHGGAEGFNGGSTFKMFGVAAALNEGYGANVRFDAKSNINFKGKTFENCDGPFKLMGDWEVRNPGYGTIDMYRGVSSSVNTYFAQLIESVGVCKTVQMAKKLGLELANGADLVEENGSFPSFILGAVNATPISLMESYATIASGGIHCDTIIVDSITSTITGSNIEPPSANCKRVISKDLAAGVARLLRGSVTSGTSSMLYTPGIEIAGKTGTVPNNQSFWQMGFTPQLVGAAMVSIDTNKRFRSIWAARGRALLSYATLQHSHWTVPGSSTASTGALLAPVFRSTLKAVTGGDYKHFPEPSSEMMNGNGKNSLSIPSCLGMTVDACRSTLTKAQFSMDVNAGGTYDDKAPVGTIVSQSPTGHAPRFSTVTVTVSKGPDPKKKEEEEKKKKEEADAVAAAQPPADPNANPPAQP
ncbi:MAG: transglycosylase domain-containing protein [Propionibacteriaceae bacterium]|jgi:membrane peptidoglycan carboxypeptidase|nr:transglycosylase domain-containing protein [Propionibacteriaceae bacterium]